MGFRVLQRASRVCCSRSLKRAVKAFDAPLRRPDNGLPIDTVYLMKTGEFALQRDDHRGVYDIRDGNQHLVRFITFKQEGAHVEPLDVTEAFTDVIKDRMIRGRKRGHNSGSGLEL